MKVKYYGHASFKLTSDKGISVIVDPYTVQDSTWRYGDIKDSADIVTMSHEHWDHNFAGIRGNPRIIKDTAPVEIKGIKIKGIPAFHDQSKGQERGKNTVFCLEMDGLRACHLGDLGHLLSKEQLAQLGRVDVLFIPVGGVYTIDAGKATELAGAINARVIIPMHFKTNKVDLPIAPVEDFLKGKKNVRRPGTSEAELKKDTLPAAPEILALEPAM